MGESQNKKTWIIVMRVFIVCAVVFCMVAIFWFSSQVSTESDSLSKNVTARIAAFFVDNFDQLEAWQQQALVSKYDNYVRKFAHLTNFTILGFCFASMCRLFFLKWYIRMPSTLIVGLLYAITDEFHQRFVPGRGCQLRDVMIDFSGVALGLIIAELLIGVLVCVIHLFRKARS